MPRYTDLDLLIDKVEETNWYHINKNGELVMGANSETDIPLYKHSDIKRVLEEAPIADVVPKSEVDGWREVAETNMFVILNMQDELTNAEAEVERLEQILNSYALQYGTVRDQQKVIDEAKREVAREIFEEISKASVDWGCYCVTLSKGAFLAEDVNRTLTELKKKYTEEVTDGKE